MAPLKTSVKRPSAVRIGWWPWAGSKMAKRRIPERGVTGILAAGVVGAPVEHGVAHPVHRGGAHRRCGAWVNESGDAAHGERYPAAARRDWRGSGPSFARWLPSEKRPPAARGEG